MTELRGVQRLLSRTFKLKSKGDRPERHREFSQLSDISEQEHKP
jgi:hypothetical protein